MILGIEIAVTIYGLIMLVTGKGVGKGGMKHWQYRLMGGLMLTMFPVAIGAGVIYGIVWMVTHHGATATQFSQENQLALGLIEAGVALAYGIGAAVWDRVLRKRLAAGEPPIAPMQNEPGF